MLESLSRSIKSMPLHYCDLYASPKYLQSRKWEIINWWRILEIVYVLDFISSPVFKQMNHLISIHNPLFIKCNFYCRILPDPPFAGIEVRQKLLWCRHIDMWIAIRYMIILCRGGFAERLILHLIVCTYYFVFK